MEGPAIRYIAGMPLNELHAYEVLTERVGWDDETARALLAALRKDPPDTLELRDVLVLRGGLPEDVARAIIYGTIGRERAGAVEASSA